MAVTRSDWPADVDPQSGFRLPLPNRDELDEAGRRRYDHAAQGGNIAGLQGPSGIMLYATPVSDAQASVQRYLRNEAGLGERVREIALLVTARCIDNQFEWTAHEPVALKCGVPRETIEAIKHRGSTEGLDLVDALVIELGRAIWDEHQVDAALFARARAHFGPHRLVSLVLLMGTHAATGALLTTFGMQLHEGREPLLPLP